MIVVTTPAGKIGSQILPHLLAANAPVRVVVRDPNKLDPHVRERVDVVTGSLDDEAVMQRALKGAQSLFLVVPPSFTDNNDAAYYLRFTEPALKAMHTQRVRRIVAVSVLGRGTELAKEAGPITACLAKDELIEKSGADYRTLWCPAIMENLLASVESIKRQGVFVSASHPSMKRPHVAAKDIAAVGAQLLLDERWTGQGGSAVLGPEDLSFDDLAAIVSEVLGKVVLYQQVPAEQYKAQLIEYGANPVFAQGIVDMLLAKDKGLDNAEQRTPRNTTSMRFRQWSAAVLRPAVLG